MKPFRHLLCLAVLLCCATAVAQDAAPPCSALVQTALDYMDEMCSATVRNQACYGNLQVNATPVHDAVDFKFDAPGDIESLTSIQSMQLSQFRLPDSWGVLFMQVQADLPDSLPGQNVTMLLFGDVTLENQSGVVNTVNTVILSATTKGRTHLRSGPGTENSSITALNAGDAMQVDGRNTAGSWLHATLEDGTSGWVFASFMEIAGDAMTLQNMEVTRYGPMQAVYFQSGIGTSNCDGVPADGMLIQTPEGMGKIHLRANDVEIELGSTAFLQALPGAYMTLSVLEGEGRITLGNQTVVVPAGSQVNIPVDADTRPTGTIGDPQPYDASLVTTLPVQYLPEPITMVVSASDAVATSTPSSTAGDFSSFTGEKKRAFCGYMPVALTMAIAGQIPSPSEYLAGQYPALVDDEQLLSALSQTEQAVRAFVVERVDLSAYDDAVGQFCD